MGPDVRALALSVACGACACSLMLRATCALLRHIHNSDELKHRPNIYIWSMLHLVMLCYCVYSISRVLSCVSVLVHVNKCIFAQKRSSNASGPVAPRCIIPLPLPRHWNNASVRHRLGRIAL